jgi:hypothetical protein
MTTPFRTFDLTFRLREGDEDLDSERKQALIGHLDSLLDLALARTWTTARNIVYPEAEHQLLAKDPGKVVRRDLTMNDREISVRVSPSTELRALGEAYQGDLKAEVNDKLWNKAWHWAGKKLDIDHEFKAVEDDLLNQHRLDTGIFMANHAMDLLEHGVRITLRQAKDQMTDEEGEKFENLIHLVPHLPTPEPTDDIEVKRRRSRRPG